MSNEEVKNTARAVAKFGVKVVNGFTGSKIWHTLAMFPPVPPAMIEDGYKDFADRLSGFSGRSTILVLPERSRSNGKTTA